MLDLIMAVKNYFRPLLASIAAIGAAIAIYKHGRDNYKKGAKDEQHAQLENFKESANARIEVEDSILRSGDGSASDRLRRDWSRD